MSDKSCSSCKHMRLRLDSDVKVEAGHESDQNWCDMNGFPTRPDACRCGGDDWEPVRSTLVEDTNELDFQLQAFKAKHGAWTTIQALVRHLVLIQRDGGNVDKADYMGDGFKVTVRTKRQ